MDLNFRAIGEGDNTLIIIHGLFGSLDNWATLGKAFATDRQVYLIDQRNHGKSPHSNEFSYEHMAEDLEGFMNSHNIKKAVILGHSMGGKTAMKFAMKFPERIEKLIIADIGPKYYPPHHQKIIEALESVDMDTIKSRGDAESTMKKHISDPGIMMFLMKNITRKGNHYAWKMNLPVIIKNIDNVGEGLELEEEYKGSTLFVRGSKSDYILDTDWEGIYDCFPNAKLATIDNAGHWLHAEQPKSFFDTIEAYINE